MSQMRKTASNRFNFPLINNIERGLRKLNRNKKSEENKISKTSEPLTPSKSNASEIIEEEMTTTITIRPHQRIPQAPVTEKNILGKTKAIIYTAFMWTIYLLILLAMFGGLERVYQRASNYFDEDADRYEFIVLDKKEMRYEIGNN